MNNRSVVVATAASSDEDVGVEDDKIVSAKDESERRARDSDTMTTKSVRADDAKGAIGGDECPVCEGCPKCEGETCPDAPTCGDASRGRGRGRRRGRAGAHPATRVPSAPPRDRRVPNTSRANEPPSSYCRRLSFAETRDWPSTSSRMSVASPPRERSG